MTYKDPAICKEYQKQYYEKNKKRLSEKSKLDYKLNRTSKKEKHYIMNYGISFLEFTQLKESQSNQCAICRISLCASGKEFCVDHDHNSGKIRGVLCMRCNIALGNFQDSISNLKKAISYLENANADNSSDS